MSGVIRRQQAVVTSAIRSFIREPTNLVLLVALPPIVIVAFDIAIDAFVGVPGIGTPGVDFPADVGELGGTLFATAFLAGLLGVFQVAGAIGPDRRLTIAGYRAWEIILARAVTIVLVSALVSAIALTTFVVLADLTPESPTRTLVALLIAAITYGLLGVIIGAIVKRELEGSLILVFIADFDSFLAVGVIPIDTAIRDYMPLARPYSLLESAIYEGVVSGGDLIGAGVFIAVLVLVALGSVHLRGSTP